MKPQIWSGQTPGTHDHHGDIDCYVGCPGLLDADTECEVRPSPAPLPSIDYLHGYTDGGNNNAADWNAALDEILPEDIDPESPSAVAAHLSQIQAAYLTMKSRWGNVCKVCLGLSPSWDGHDRNPPCERGAMEMLEEAILGRRGL